MHRSLPSPRSLLAALALACLAAPASAQSDILLQLRSGSPAGDRFRVDSAGGVVALGEIGIGIIPASGAGWRMMWHPQKTAFRAGYADVGGQFDEANIGYYSWAGGALSAAAGIYSFAMGNMNTVEQGSAGGMALGGSNKIWGANFAQYGTALGWDNDVLDDYGVSAGYSNWSDGIGAVAIGWNTTADADYSVALGYRASTNGHMGALVLSDASSTDSTEASANNQFMSRYAGGYRLYTNATVTTGVFLNAGGSSWNVISDAHRKERFLAVDGEDVLSRIRALPVTTWRYVGEEDRAVRHMGPMAQDWHRAFGFSADSTTINMSDFDGVNLAAVKALDARTREMQARMDDQERRIERLRADNEALRASNAAAEARNAEMAARNAEMAARNAEMEARIARLEALARQP